MKKTIFSAVIILLLINVSNAQNVGISGVLTNHETDSAFLEDIYKGDVIKSCYVGADGKFSMKATIPQTNFYRMTFNSDNYLIIVLSPKDSLYIEFDLNTLNINKIMGSKETELYYASFDSLENYEIKLQKLKAQIELEKKDFMIKQIKENPYSLTNLLLLDQMPPEENYDIYKIAIDSLYSKYPQNDLVLQFRSMFERSTPLQVGMKVPEISLPDTANVFRKLSDLQGKYVLIDFWASWCAPCRMENPNLVRLYEKYKSKGFDIYSVSIDGMASQRNPKESWLQAIKSDSLIWENHVSELNGWETTVVDEFNIEGIPFTVLIDKEGYIIGLNLSGIELENKLIELFGE